MIFGSADSASGGFVYQWDMKVPEIIDRSNLDAVLDKVTWLFCNVRVLPRECSLYRNVSVSEGLFGYILVNFKQNRP